jgi:peptidoglycan hydrolase-like protein with peptidoglycan-binding domain
MAEQKVRDLKRGDEGDDVKELQEQLNAAGAEPPLKVDGHFGPLTDKAVWSFQAEMLGVDGIVGPKTRAALKDAQPKK